MLSFYYFPEILSLVAGFLVLVKSAVIVRQMRIENSRDDEWEDVEVTIKPLFSEVV